MSLGEGNSAKCHPALLAYTGHRCRECFLVHVREQKLVLRKKRAEAEGRVFKSRPAKKPPRLCAACSKETPRQNTYCSPECRPVKPRKVAVGCSHCGAPRPNPKRSTCSDACAKARIPAIGRSEAVRARRRRDKAKSYRKADKPQVIARMTQEQEGRCKACGDVKNLVLDHCHLSGAPRAMLCIQCNAALGLLREDPVRIRMLATYAEAIA